MHHLYKKIAQKIIRLDRPYFILHISKKVIAWIALRIVRLFLTVLASQYVVSTYIYLPKEAIWLRIADLREVKNGGALTFTLVSILRQAMGVFPIFKRSSILKVFSHWLGLEAPDKIFHVTSASI